MEYMLHIAILIGIYSILAVSLNLVVGHLGLVSLAHAVFYGIGAYAAAFVALRLDLPFPCGVVSAILLSCVLGVLVGAPSLRVRDEYFVITSFACQIIAFSVFNNWSQVTGGPLGLPGIPPPGLLGWSLSSKWAILVLTGLFCLSTLLIAHRLVHSPFGRVLKAIREDEVFAEAHGKAIAHFKIVTFVISAGLASMAGVVYAHYISFIDPTSFTLMESILVISMLIIGGSGSLGGPFLGAILLVALPEALRFVGLPSGVAANVRQVFYGILLVLFMVFRPQGLLGQYAFDAARDKA